MFKSVPAKLRLSVQPGGEMESYSQGLEQIQGRLLKLEKQNRRFKQLGAVALIVAAALLVMGQASAPRKTVEANEFILRDSSGNIRARLSMNVPKGAAPSYPAAAQLVFFDEKGKERASLDGGTSAGGFAGLTLYDGQERNRASFTESDAFGIGPSLLLLDEKGHVGTRLKYGEVLAVDNVSAHEVSVADSVGNIRARLFVTEKHTGNITLPGTSTPVPMTFPSTPTLSLYDEKGKTTGTLDDLGVRFGNSEGHPSFSLALGSLMISGDGHSGMVLTSGTLSMSDEQGFSAVLGQTTVVTPRTGETRKTSAASLLLFDNQRNVIWKAP
jgi:hypothetical protein